MDSSEDTIGQAAEWISRLADETTEANRRAFIAWLSDDSRHLREILEQCALQLEARRAWRSMTARPLRTVNVLPFPVRAGFRRRALSDPEA